MTNAQTVARRLAERGTVNSGTAVFVRMDGRFAVVNIGLSTVTVPCVGFYPPVAGMAVRVDWVNGSPAVTGPVTPLNPLGVISGTGAPKATVTVNGVPYLLFYRSGYTPTVGDQVEINWATGVIQGKVTGSESPPPPEEAGGAVKPFSVTVRAANSGRYQSGSGWWGNAPWASSSNDGIWVYGKRVKDAVGSGTVTKIEIYLPLVQQVGVASIGLHPHGAIPGGAPTITSKTDLPQGRRSGWQVLPASFGSYVAAGNRGVAVADGGYNIWRGTAEDSLSGALRISGTR
ncbi:minor tail protein [Microbacterium phage Footloose]|uniref:Minor tail protein n=1 Tax=Microbacterium phage Footloose TaxID=2836048 RepID=A0A8F3EAI7_9CAUD|nr:minor tail protein [Microbacterium phage Footloose]QWY84603.1 minor tail protein [Microbacterium phage Footloose]